MISRSAAVSEVMEWGAKGNSENMDMQEVEKEVTKGKSQSNRVHNKCMQTLMPKHHHYLVLSQCHCHLFVQQQ